MTLCVPTAAAVVLVCTLLGSFPTNTCAFQQPPTQKRQTFLHRGKLTELSLFGGPSEGSVGKIPTNPNDR